MLVLVPFAAPVHATNASPLAITVNGFNPIEAGPSGWELSLTIANPATNQYAVTAITIASPNSNWYVYDCFNDAPFSYYFRSCTDSSNGYTVEFTATTPLPPGASDIIVMAIEAPNPSAALLYPYSGKFTTTVQDQSSSAFYVGPTFSIQVIADSSSLAETVTPGGSNSASTYTAGTAPYGISAQLTCSTSEPGCTTGYENGVQIEFGESHYGADAVYSFTATKVTTSGSGSSGGTASTVFQPSNVASVIAGIGTAEPWAGVSTCPSPETCTFFSTTVQYASAITTIPGTPSSVGFFTPGPTPWSVTMFLDSPGTTTTTTVGYPTGYTGAILCNVAAAACASEPNAVSVAVTDRFGNPIAFAASGTGVIVSGMVTLQTASGAVWDAATLPSTIGPTAAPVAATYAVPDNYFQGNAFATAGVITATITGTYNGGSFSVSGSSPTIETGTYATTVNFQTTNHVNPFPAKNVAAGKSYTFEVSLPSVESTGSTPVAVTQANVPITVGICAHTTCAGTTTGYSGVIATPSGVTNSSGDYAATLTVSTTAGAAAIVNAKVSAPTTANPTATFTGVATNPVTTIAGPAAKFTVIVGIGSALEPSPITSSFPSQTVFVNVITSDAYGNPVSTVGGEEVSINLVATPSTLSDSNPDIPTNCYETNGTTGNGCSAGYGSFGPIAWTLPSSGTATIYATGVLNGALITSATVTITIVSKTPTLAVTSPKPLSGVIYSNNGFVQFRGWAAVSTGYNGLDSMSTLGWKIGSASWQSTALAASTNATWSIVASLPAGTSTVTFNASDTKGNTVVSPAYTVLVDTQPPTITDVTANGATLNPGQLFTAKIVVDEGDLNATSVGVTVNGTALASSAITVSGSNSLGSSVTYTMTASLPTGTWNVVVSASTLAGLSASSTPEIVSVTVPYSGSIIFTLSTATYGTVGAYQGVTVTVTNLWNTPQTIVVYATLKSGSGIFIAQGTTTLAPGASASVFCVDLQSVPAGTYTVTFAAVTTSNLPVSAPTTPISLTT